MKNEVVFSTNDLLKEFLSGNLSEQRCTITTKSALKGNKKSRVTKELFESVFDDGVQCVSTRNVLIGVSYRDMLDRYPKDDVPTGQEVITEESKLPWGEWVEGSNSLILHKGEYYLRVYQVEKGSIKTYVNNQGSPIPNEKILRLDEFLPADKEDSDKKFIVNTLRVSSIERIEFEDSVLIRG
jgi:hypothetical protein